MGLLLIPLILSLLICPCYSQVEKQFKIDEKDFQKLRSENGLLDTTTNEPGKSINYRTDQLSTGVWKGQIAGLVVNYPELELRITQTEPSIKGMWRQVMIGAGPDVPVVDTLRGEIIGKNDTGKILLILKTSFHDSAYYLKYLSGKCFTRDLGLHNELHKHTFFGIAESEQTLKYGYPGSFFEFRKEDWTEQRKK